MGGSHRTAPGSEGPGLSAPLSTLSASGHW